MKILFIHQNLPGQFRHVMTHYARVPGVEVFGLGDAARIRENFVRPIEGVTVYGYAFNSKHESSSYRALRSTDQAVRRGTAVAKSLKSLRDQGLRPDVIYGHPGWGEMLYVRDLFPDARIASYCEFYFNRSGQDYGFDTEFSPVQEDDFHVRTENMTHAVSLLASDLGISPTRWQQSRYPAELQSKIATVHDGVDTRVIKPDPTTTVILPARNLALSSRDEVVTFASRNLEPYRGFHMFMRALPELLRRRRAAHVLIVGGDQVSYGRPLKGRTYREHLLTEVGERLDLSRVHFLGHLSHRDYLRVLQISTAHVYLTYPFVLSWSMLEAMASGCVVIGSHTAPVEEIIEDGRNGLLVDFFDRRQLVETVAQVCAEREAYGAMRLAARATVADHYDLQTVCLPRQIALLENQSGASHAPYEDIASRKTPKSNSNHYPRVSP
ncbi:glycosyltransferase [Paraburkholderia phenazinium]|uniref:glycosyltransferase n=1 Tax=Paraburkholderia phenazinium TaxID=60549 RepID=UPI000B82AAA6|nr:glycosyltransferase [Paraburkholderia phenazinium]